MQFVCFTLHVSWKSYNALPNITISFSFIILSFLTSDKLGLC